MGLILSNHIIEGANIPIKEIEGGYKIPIKEWALDFVSDNGKSRVFTLREKLNNQPIQLRSEIGCQ